jgi:hypothetical protein
MEGEVLDLMEVCKFFALALVAGFDVSEYFEVAEASASFEDGTENHVFFVECKIDYEGVVAISVQLEVVDEREAAVIDSDDVRAHFQKIVALVSGQVDYLFYAVEGSRVHD